MVAVEAASPYTGWVVYPCLIAGGVLLLVGLLAVLLNDLPAERAAAKAAKKVADDTKAEAAKDGTGKVDAQAHGAIKDVVGSVAELAKGLKDLTVATRLLVIGVLLVLVAALASGADALGDNPVSAVGSAVAG